VFEECSLIFDKIKKKFLFEKDLIKQKFAVEFYSLIHRIAIGFLAKMSLESRYSLFHREPCCILKDFE
jgi:hypothetical protein